MALTALPSETPGARLNDMVAAGNCPWWLMVSGVLVRSMLAIEVSGTSAPPAVVGAPALATTEGVLPAVLALLAAVPALDAAPTPVAPWPPPPPPAVWM